MDNKFGHPPIGNCVVLFRPEVIQGSAGIKWKIWSLELGF